MLFLERFNNPKVAIEELKWCSMMDKQIFHWIEPVVSK